MLVSMVAFMLKFLQNTMAILMNVTHLYPTIYKKWFVTIFEELQSNVTVLKDMIGLKLEMERNLVKAYVWMMFNVLLITFVLIECFKPSIIYIYKFLTSLLT